MFRRLLQGPHRVPALLLAVVVVWCVWWLAVGGRPWELGAGAVGWEDDVVRGLYWAAGANLVLAVVLLATLPLWNRGLSPVVTGSRAGRPDPAMGRGVFWGLIAAAVVLAGVLRLPLAARSLWWDEAWQVRQATHGLIKEDPKEPGSLRYFPTSWARCAWYYQKPTNHVPAALGSKLALGLWHRATGAEAGRFSELAVRAPTLLAALASVAAIAVLLRRWGFPAAGVTAAFLLAVHPWHIRYGVDARSYSLLVLWTILGCLWLTRIFESGVDERRGDRRRWWWLFGLNQCLLLWSYVSSVYVAAAFFGVAAILCLRSGWSGRDRMTALGRLVAVNVAAAMLFLQLAAPLVFQAARWLGSMGIDHPVTIELVGNTLIQALFGVERSWPATPESEGLATFASLTKGSAVGALLLILSAAALIGFGAARLFAGDRRGFAIGASVVAGTALYLGATWVRGEIFFERFAIYLLVPVVGLLALGASGLGEPRDGRPARVRRQVGAGLGVVLLYGFFVLPQIEVLTTRPYAPLRDVAATLGAPGPDRPVTLLGYGLGGRIVEVYNPHVEYILEEPGRTRLEERMRTAASAGTGLLVYHGYNTFNRTLFPSAFELLDDPTYFQEIAAFPGIEPEFHFRIFQYTGKPVPAPGEATTPPARDAAE